ncbi:unnamed protein product [Gadus morhua 'NCC']|uniref:uncharacterized protein si:dkeyp-55f12.3 n=1 Tax=Gadus macrocephalus TaxID=80720 RepID=UPI0028CB1A1A|nr:uncharacterized protein si:dkeyp-55f12.3 [Gadus macrocephalus]
MAPHGVTLRGELRYRDGVKKNIDVHIEGNLTSMIVGIKTLREQVSDLLTELTVQEKGSVAGDKEELGSSDEDDESDEEMEPMHVSEPPAKKSKPVKK